MARTHPWEVSDALWERVEPLIPPAPSHAKGGRPRILDRQAFAAIIYVLRDFHPVECETCENWERVPPSMIAFRNGNRQASSKRSGKPD